MLRYATACSNKFFTLKWELEFILTAFAVILMLMALPILLKVELNFEVKMYRTIFVSHIRKTALNMWSVVKTYLKVLRYLHAFAAIVGRKPSSPKRFEDFALLDFPFWGHLNIDLIFFFYFTTQSSNFSLLGMKTRPWKFLKIWPATRHDYLHFTSARF